MNRRTAVLFLFLAIAITFVAAPAYGFEEEHQPDGNDCMGPTDPFCPLPPGSGSGDWPPETVPMCYKCELDAYDPLDLAGSAYYRCNLVDPIFEAGWTQCQNGDITCNFDGGSPCQVA